MPFLNTLSKKLSFKGNWFIYWIGWLLVAVFIVFLARVTSLRFAVLMGAISVFLIFVGLEVVSRRQWERRLLYKLEQQDKEYHRLVREIARNRNEVSQLKEGLAETGRLTAKATSGRRRNSVEERMLKEIAERLTEIGTAPRPVKVDDLVPRKIEDIELDITHEVQPETADATAMIVDNNKKRERPDISNEKGVLKLLKRAVDEDRVDVFLQTIVNLPQRKRRYAELLSRIRIDGDEYLPASEYIHLAMDADMLPALDNLQLLKALQLVRDSNSIESVESAYFCNISPLTLTDSKFMGDLVEFVTQNRHLAPRLVFEISQKDFKDQSYMTRDTMRVLHVLAELGCRFSMDGVASLDLDIEFLQSRHIRYIKMEAPHILQSISQKGGFERLKSQKSELDKSGIDLIVTHIETEKELVELLDLGIDYGQGYLFSEPENPKNL